MATFFDYGIKKLALWYYKGLKINGSYVESRVKYGLSCEWIILENMYLMFIYLQTVLTLKTLLIYFLLKFVDWVIFNVFIKAVAAVGAMSDRQCIHSNGTETFHYSAQDVVSCCHTCGSGCHGGTHLFAWIYWVEEGIVSGGEFGSSQVWVCYLNSQSWMYGIQKVY